jgi:predicted nuclease with TOPRIM domain
MDLQAVLITVGGALAGLVAWLYRLLHKRMDQMEIDVLKRPDRSEIRTLMSDKLAPIQVEYHSLNNRLDTLSKDNSRLNDKVDRLLEICTKLAHERN